MARNKSKKTRVLIYGIPAAVLSLFVIVYIVWAYITFPRLGDGNNSWPAGYGDAFAFTLIFLVILFGGIYAAYCGIVSSVMRAKRYPTIRNRRTVAWVLGSLLGVTGAHDFYRKKYILGFIHLALLILAILLYAILNTSQIGFDISPCSNVAEGCFEYTPNILAGITYAIVSIITIFNIGWSLIETFIWLDSINKNRTS